MQHSNYTSAGRQATVIARITRQMTLAGRMALDAIGVLREKTEQELVILERVVQLGYLTEEHIAEVTGISDGLSELLDELCANHQLRRRKISGVAIYWIRPKGLLRVPKIEVPGFGVIDLTENPSMMIGFCRMSVSKQVSMHHLLECSEAIVRLYVSTDGTPLGDRTARLIQRLYNQGKTKGQKRKLAVASKGHKVDFVVVSPDGKISVYEVELSSHGKEGTRICLQLVRSKHIAKVVYISYTEAQQGEVERRFTKVVEDYPKQAEAVGKCVAVLCRDWRPPALTQIMPAGVSRSTARRRTCKSRTASSPRRKAA